MKNQKIALMIVPTGVGASIGGYAGDANGYARKIARHIPLIVNPNIVNAAVFSGITKNMLYTEGRCINEFLRGNIGLLPSHNNKIGVIFDKAIPENVLNIHINTLNAIKTVYGIDILGYEITDKNVGVEFFNTETEISSGTVKCPETLTEAGRKLLERGAQVLAVVCFFEEPPEDDYENGEGVDIVGGVEAVISHYLSKELGCPCVHAPAFEDVTISSGLVNPKVSAEFITPTFLPCLLFGLENAPLITKDLNSDCLTNKDLHSVIAPFDALGSSAVLDAVEKGIQVYAIKENKTVLSVDKFAIQKSDSIIELDTYEDYIDILKAEFLI